MAQGQVLQGDMAVSAAEEGKQSKQAEQESNHRAGIFSGSAPPDQSLGVGRSFGEGQDVERALTARRLVHDHRNQCQRASPCHASTFRRYSCVVDQEIERTLLLEDAATPRHTGADERELRPALRTELSVERGFVLAQGTLETAPRST